MGQVKRHLMNEFDAWADSGPTKLQRAIQAYILWLDGSLVDAHTIDVHPITSCEFEAYADDHEIHGIYHGSESGALCIEFGFG